MLHDQQVLKHLQNYIQYLVVVVGLLGVRVTPLSTLLIFVIVGALEYSKILILFLFQSPAIPFYQAISIPIIVVHAVNAAVLLVKQNNIEFW